MFLPPWPSSFALQLLFSVRSQISRDGAALYAEMKWRLVST